MLKIIMSLGKVLQRHAYDVLSHKYSVIIILISFSTILISVFQFGEVWMTWSQEKYEAVFNSFSDNIVGKSLQNKLCQNVPVDVVYTWVNGSDPVLLQQLQDYRFQLQKETSKKCPHADCVPSHIITFRQWLSDDTVADILPQVGVREMNISFARKIKLGSGNWTFIELSSPGQAADTARQGVVPNASVHHAHWTSDGSVHGTYNELSAVIISGIPLRLLQEPGRLLHARLTEGLHSEIQNFWLYFDKRLIVVMLNSQQAVSHLLQVPNVTVDGYSVNITKAHLIMELPLIGNSKDFSPSRFEDKEELRYSLRSLEKFAPWVRHVYLVTNGQIPYWLDLESTRLTVITHDMIFPDPSHLPTFSSPAIEAHLHRIPGLSSKFLYLNDDVMFGKEVWPDDFITNANGQKVYLSWPVPDCSESCPWSWVADGSCDISCNTSECSFDGGDCDLSSEDEFGAYDENRRLVNYDDDINPYHENQHLHGHESANDNLLRNMNFGGDIILEDVPDPAKRMNSLLDILIKKNAKTDDFRGNFTFFRQVADMNERWYANISRSKNISSTSQFNQGHKLKANNESSTRRNQIPAEKRISLIKNITDLKTNSILSSVTPVQRLFRNNSTINQTLEQSTLSYVQRLLANDSLNDDGTYGDFYPKLSQKDNLKTTEISTRFFRRFEKNKRQYPSFKRRRDALHNMHYEGETLEIKHNESENPHLKLRSNQSYNNSRSPTLQATKSRVLKNSSYNTKLSKLYQKLNGKPEDFDRLGRVQQSDYDMDWRSEERFSANTKKKQKPLKVFDAQEYGLSPPPGKKPKDTFAESLLYVNRLFNKEFGFEPRKVPAHMPHLIDIDIMERLQARFAKEWYLTSSHQVRNAQDMQFAFSYFYFLMSSKQDVPLSDIFDTFDTDHSGTWSDREIRTLLTRSFELPLNYARVVKFENDIINCSKDFPEENILTPPYERYQDSKLPVVSKNLIINCKSIADMLKKKFGTKKIYRYQIEREKHHDISFKMLNSNISQLVSHLDDIRRDPKKFICLNDNLDPDRTEDNAIARAILQDMYESLFPKPSSFELPPEFRNRFLHMTELQTWRKSRNTVRTIVYVCLAILIAFTLVNFFHVECRWLQRKLFHKTRPQQSAPVVPCV